ncbi:MAG: hypothetical protein RJA57_1408 [Bacteroidota bacterium]
MALFLLDNDPVFPPAHLADPNGLLAVGGDLSPIRLLTAYRHGIFPWYEDDLILWWSPDPRFVLFPNELRTGKASRAVLKKKEFTFTVNRDFRSVIRACKSIPRPGQAGTWITDDVEAAYTRLHEMGIAHSAEAWKDGELAGGLYGIRLGKVFFGESMFSLVSQASRFAFLRYVEQLKESGVELVDCQLHTAYLESFGARMIPRAEFLGLLDRWVDAES